MLLIFTAIYIKQLLSFPQQFASQPQKTTQLTVIHIEAFL